MGQVRRGLGFKGLEGLGPAEEKHRHLKTGPVCIRTATTMFETRADEFSLRFCSKDNGVLVGKKHEMTGKREERTVTIGHL